MEILCRDVAGALHYDEGDDSVRFVISRWCRVRCVM